MAAEPAIEENVIEMTMIGHAIHTSGRRRSRRLAVCMALSSALTLLCAPSALAIVQWQVTSTHGPQNFAPGGTGQYILQAYNVGTSATSTTYEIDDTLPPGVTATDVAANDPNSPWSCTGFGVAGGTVACQHAGNATDRVASPGDTGLTDASQRGAAAPLQLTVTIDANATPATAPNSVSVFGGAGNPRLSDGTTLCANVTTFPPPTRPVCASVDDPTTISSTPLGFGFTPGTVLGDAFDSAAPDATPVRQAASHPFEARINFQANLKLGEDVQDPVFGDLFYTVPAGDIKTLIARFPPGFLGDPQAVPQCDQLLLGESGPDGKGDCPANTQVGSIDLFTSQGKRLTDVNSLLDVPVYNLKPEPGVVAELGFHNVSVPVVIKITLDPTDHYAVVGTIENTTEFQLVRAAQLTLWGVPADPAHDPLRLDPTITDPTAAMDQPFTGASVKPFLTIPSLCGVPAHIELRADSWEDPGAFTPTASGGTITLTGCDDPRFAFHPTISVQPDALTPNTPTGLDVDLSVPQRDDTVADPSSATDLYAQNGQDAAIATPPLLNASVTLPEGMRVSPSSADGLLGCSPTQIGLGTNDDPTCPDASKIGTLSIDTPLLPDPLTGAVYLATQNDNPFDSLLAIYLVAKGPGVLVKIPGKVAPNPVTGQLTATFQQTPPLPFSRLRVHFNDGPRAPLVTPSTCGAKTTTAQLQAWNPGLTADASDAFTISADGHGAPCAGAGFDPSFSAGTSDSVAGKDSPLVTKFGRGDRDAELSAIDVTLPKGLLGRIASTTLCADAPANAGTCGAESMVGGVTVAAGAGSNPFYITDGRVFITGPYKGAPYGLSIVVHAKAGPLDLGDVVVRAQVQVDRTTAALRIVSDPLPTILAGIPLQIRLVNVKIDRPGFTFNPTSCTPTSASARLTATDGQAASKSSRFQVGGCAALPFAPQLSLTIGGKRHTRAGVTTSLAATVRMAPGQANIGGVAVTLPSTLNARLPVIRRACSLADFYAGRCTSATQVGTAVAVTPLLRDPLRGPVYFVKNPARVLPDMMVALRGQVDVDLTGKVSIPGGKRLATNFDTVPDVPITSFTLRIVSGGNGPVGIVRNLCTAKGKAAPAQLTFHAQSGKVLERSQRVHVVGCAKSSGRRTAG
jgi:hypothetical protein